MNFMWGKPRVLVALSLWVCVVGLFLYLLFLCLMKQQYGSMFVFFCLGLVMLYFFGVHILDVNERYQMIDDLSRQEREEENKQEQYILHGLDLLEGLQSPQELKTSGSIAEESQYFEVVGYLLGFHLDRVPEYEKFRVLKQFLNYVDKASYDYQIMIKNQDYYYSIYSQYQQYKKSRVTTPGSTTQHGLKHRVFLFL
jgi:hypothetical protein